MDEVIANFDDSLPEPWKQYFDDNYQMYYYFNSVTSETQWEKPSLKSSNTSTGNFNATSGKLNQKMSTNEVKTITKSVVTDSSITTTKVLTRKATIDSNYEEYLQTFYTNDIDTEDMHDSDFAANNDLLVDDNDDLYDEYGIPKIDENSYDEEQLEESQQSFTQQKHQSMQEHRLNHTALKRKTSVELIGGKNQDYIGMAKIYHLQIPYADRRHNPLCVLCNESYPEDVFFPCEHKCVCRKCILQNAIVIDSKLKTTPNGYSNCSLCAAIIKLILPYENGAEIEKYWNWVYEVRTELPSGFKKNFRHSASVIKAVYMNDNDHQKNNEHEKSGICTIC
eukprot:gene11205-15029_t